MNGPSIPPDDTSPSRSRLEVYADLLHEAQDLRQKLSDRLRNLHDRYPSALPASLLDELDQGRTDPRRERRAQVRERGGADRVPAGSGSYAEADARVLDRSPGGLLLLLSQQVEPGAAVRVRLTDESGRSEWVDALVRHCRRTEEGWATGCELPSQGRPSG